MKERDELIFFLITSVADVTGVEPSEISEDTKLRTEGLVDSLQFIDLMVLVEQERGLYIEDEEVLDRIDTISEAADALLSARSQHG